MKIMEKKYHTFDRWEAKLFSNISVPHFGRFIKRHALYQSRHVTAARYRTPTPKGLELHVLNSVRVFVHPDLEFHYIATSGSSDETGAYVHICFEKRADIARGGVMIQDLFVIETGVGGAGRSKDRWTEGGGGEAARNDCGCSLEEGSHRLGKCWL